MLVLYPLVVLFDPYRARVYDWVAMTWMRLSMACTGISPLVIGREHLLPPSVTVLYVCNHNSYLDIYTVAFLGRYFKFVSKSTVFATPIIGWAMRMARQIGIERESRRDQLRVFREMISRLEHGVSLLLFPEGTRSKDGVLRAFKQGPFRVAKEAGVPIVPLTITGTAEVMPPWAWAPLRWPKQRITLTIHPAISSTSRSVSELIEAARMAIASALPPALRGR
jgi:1-acyl-sn-glycerol-3-phosphate acyltransferase